MSRPLPPGLYPDPSGAPWLRYWNGEQWTGHLPLPPKPNRTGLWIGLSLVAVVVLFFGGCATLIAIGPQSHSRSDRFGGLVAPTGTPVRDGNFEFVVSGVSTPANWRGDPRPRGQWIVATMTVRNVDDERHGFLANNQKLVDSAGNTYAGDAAAAVVMNNASMVIDMNPGVNKTVKVPFDVPARTLPTAIELHDSVFSGGVRVQMNS